MKTESKTKWVKQLDEFAKKKYEDEDRGFENIMLANAARDEAHEEERNYLFHGIDMAEDPTPMSILMEARAGLLNDKCAGVDRVVAELLKALSWGSLRIIRQHFNHRYNGTDGGAPPDWKQLRITLLMKKGHAVQV